MGVAACEVARQILPVPAYIIEGPVSAEHLKNLHLNNELDNFRPPEKQKLALEEIARLPEGMVYIARRALEVIGYVTFHYPDSYSRWRKHQQILELGAVEVSPPWRKIGVGRNLLKKAFSNPVFENYIVITIEFYWHWDLSRSGLTVYEYQKMLEKFFGLAGLKKKATDDPDITEHPANVLMARVGRNVSKRDLILFEEMLFENKRN